MKIGDSMRRELTRLTFLKLSGAGLAGATLLGGTGYERSAGEFVTEAAAAAALDTARCRTGEPWSNYTETLSLVPHSTCTPESLADVVAIISEAEAANKRVHAFGSKWSFSDCAFTSDYVVDTKQLNQELNTVKDALRPGQSSLLYHVEAGITIRDLYQKLDEAGLALETMGGASGQTLAGAISTGTHGGDKFIAPLADSVVAIHLVGAGGTQYWIEPSPGITDPAPLRARVVPDVDPQNIIYGDETFDACLVSLGCMGVIYAVVLRVRGPYGLVETSDETTWQAFKDSASAYLRDPSKRFLQVLLDPYTDDNNENRCLLTTRSEFSPDDAGPLARPRGDRDQADVDSWNAIRSTNPFLADHLPESPPSAVELVVWIMILSLQPFPLVQKKLNDNGWFDATGLSTNEERLAQIVRGILTDAPDQRGVMVSFYWPILLTQWPTGTLRGSSYSVMDSGYGHPRPPSEPGYSIELQFPAMDEEGKLGFVDFIDALITTVNAATQTFFAGYISLRFTGPTRAYLGMQQWNQTCSVEIAVLQGVQGLFELLSELFRIGFNLGGLPHWGQQLDLGVQGHGSLYPQYGRWRQVYAKMSNNFTAQTFENGLSSRWNLTTPGLTTPSAPIASIAPLLLEDKAPVPIASILPLLLEEKAPVPIASIALLLLGD